MTLDRRDGATGRTADGGPAPFPPDVRMADASRDPSPEPAPPELRARRIAELSAEHGFELPSFEGPLEAYFAAGSTQRSGDPIYLGGDLHAVHPLAVREYPGRGHDATLDAATIGLHDEERAPLEVRANFGIWFVALEAERHDPAPIFSLHDSAGRMRTWLLIPPPVMLVGLGHFWLPSVRPL